jgi:hypothetical protein
MRSIEQHKLGGLNVGITDGSVMKGIAEMGSDGMIYLPSVQAILTFCLSNLNGCNVGITDGRDL